VIEKRKNTYTACALCAAAAIPKLNSTAFWLHIVFWAMNFRAVIARGARDVARSDHRHIARIAQRAADLRHDSRPGLMRYFAA
jgi:hypothetical protein